MNDLFPGLVLGKATRDAYGEALRDLGREHADIVVLDADLAKSTKSWAFGAEFPDRFFNVGIQEANMVGMAGGLAMAGKVPFISSFACFVILKGFDQLRMAVSYPNLNVKIAGSHQGISVGEDGASQQSVEDVALLDTRAQKAWFAALIAALVAVPFFAGPLWLDLANQILLGSVGAVALMLLTGFAGCEVRFVRRNTETYAELARMLWHPASLHDEPAARGKAADLLTRHGQHAAEAPDDGSVVVEHLVPVGGRAPDRARWSGR